MRGVIDGLESPVSLTEQLPAVYQEDEFAMRFVSALDVAMAPVLATMDNLAAYVDPHFAPCDFLAWLGGWVGVELGDSWHEQSRRADHAEAAHDHRRTGTAARLADALTRATRCEIEIVESGGATWSRTPGSPFPGAASASMHVRVRACDPDEVDLTHLDRVVASLKPAHVAHSVEVVAK